MDEIEWDPLSPWTPLGALPERTERKICRVVTRLVLLVQHSSAEWTSQNASTHPCFSRPQIIGLMVDSTISDEEVRGCLLLDLTCRLYILMARISLVTL